MGADSSEEYGDYFAWGETAPYYEAGYAGENPQNHWKTGKSAGYDWASYGLAKGSYTTLTKYCNAAKYGYDGFTDSLTELEYGDDAARAVAMHSWRMPTREEWMAIRDEANFTWTWNSDNNGRKVTSNIEGYKDGRSIFLPAAGYRGSTNLEGVGSSGFYWSSSLYTSYTTFAWSVDIYSTYVSESNVDRYFGQSIRPVTE